MPLQFGTEEEYRRFLEKHGLLDEQPAEETSSSEEGGLEEIETPLVTCDLFASSLVSGYLPSELRAMADAGKLVNHGEGEYYAFDLRDLQSLRMQKEFRK